MLQKSKIIAMVVTIRLASPLPDAPMKRDKMITIAKFKIAIASFIINVEAIFFIIIFALHELLLH